MELLVTTDHEIGNYNNSDIFVKRYVNNCRKFGRMCYLDGEIF